jgi:selenide,water dikinase
MAVTGTIDPRRIVTNAGARPGDVLVLTKPLGTGILASALKKGAIDADGMASAIDWMTRLNAGAARAMLAAGAHAATDVTGYGLLGHAGEMMRASGVRLHLRASAVPVHDRVRDLLAAGIAPRGTRTNAQLHASFTEFAEDVDADTRLILSDAQTSGGLLIAVPAVNLNALCDTLREANALAAEIGFVGEGLGVLVAT